jgi:hypothetical protein
LPGNGGNLPAARRSGRWRVNAGLRGRAETCGPCSRGESII